MTISFTSVFGGTTIQPSDVSWDALTFASDVRLIWPLESPPGLANSPLVPRLLDCVATASSLSIFMPDATQGSTGNTTVFNNIGPNTFLVKDALGGILLSIDPATVWTLYLTDNTQAQGTWRSYQNGASTSQAQAAALAGAGLVALGATLGRSAGVNTTSTTPSSVGAASRATVLRWTGGAGTLTIDPAATIGPDWLMELRNDGSGNWTVDPSGIETVNGGPTLTLAPGDSCELHCDGAAFYTVGLGKSAVLAFDLDTINIAGGPGTVTLAGSDLNRVGYKFVGLLTGNQDVVVPNTLQQYWVDNSTTGPFNVTVRTAAGSGVIVVQGARTILYCDGTSVVDADTQGISIPIAIAQGGTGATNASGARTNLGATATGGAVFTAATAAAARAALGSTVVGDAVFVAASQAAALTALGAPGLALANLFTTTQGVQANTLSALLQLISLDGTANENIGLELQRNGGSPLNGDRASSLIFTDFSALGTKRTLAKLVPKFLDITDTAEDAELELHTIVAGADNTAGVWGQGLRIGAPTDGDLGAGWVNADVGLAVDGLPAAFIPRSTTKSAAYNVAKLDCGGLFRWTTAGFTATLLAATQLNGFVVGLVNDAATGDVTVAPAAGTINGVASIPIPPGYGVWVACDGVNYRTIGRIAGPGIPIGRVVAAASADLTLSFAAVPATARAVYLSFEDLIPATNAVDLWWLVSTDGGATYDNAAAEYAYHALQTNTAAGSGAGPASASAAQIQLDLTSVVNAAGIARCSGETTIKNPKRAAKPAIITQLSYQRTAGIQEGGTVYGFRLTDHSIDGMRLRFSAGNVTSGALEGWWN